MQAGTGVRQETTLPRQLHQLSLSENGEMNVDNCIKCVHIQDCTAICGLIRLCWD